MDITSALNEISKLRIDDRIQIVQAIWDGIEADSTTETLHELPYLDINEAQKREIDRRINEFEMNPDNTLTWNEIKASIKGR